MELNEYQKLAMRTNGTTQQRDMETNALLGLSGEVGEITDYFKKNYFHGHPFDRSKIKNELGDVMWYVAQMATAMGYELSEVAEFNIHKLQTRYPEKFNTEDSIRRVDVHSNTFVDTGGPTA
jgi:NTP pyrophosphatase (non-canonical NTP hydrolase)